MTPKEENEMTLDQVLGGIDYFIAHEDEDSLLEVAEHLFKKAADKQYYELITYLFDASSRWLTDKKRWVLKASRRRTEIKGEGRLLDPGFGG